ncbi:hypothetical protein TNCV_3976731 [Trichonephila clavipes]|nr:hypothetical protein TNCV_3976731 [Trichonephila clavipes]
MRTKFTGERNTQSIKKNICAVYSYKHHLFDGVRSRQRARRTPVVNPSFEHHTGDTTIWLSSTPILRVYTPELFRDLPSLFLFHQHSPFMNMHALSGI